MTFSPKLSGSGAAFEQPVVSESNATSILNIASGVLGAFTPEAPTAAQIKDQRELNIRNQYADSLVQAEQLRSQGFDKQAAEVERNAAVVAARAGADLGSSQYTGLTEQITGRPADFLGQSAERVALMQAMETPEYQEALIATLYTHKDATPAERQEYAMAAYNRKTANRQTIEATLFDWNDGDGQSSRLSVISDWRSTHLGVIEEASRRGVRISNDTIEQARNAFFTLKSEMDLTRPAGLPSESWKPIENALNGVEKQLEYLGSLTSIEELSADAARDLVDAFDSLHRESDITKTERNIMTQMILRDPQAFKDTGVLSSGRFKEILEAASNTSVDDRIEHDDTVEFTPKELEDVTVADVIENFDAASAIASTGYGVNNGKTDPNDTTWTVLAERGFAHMYGMASDHSGWVTKEGYASVFSPALFKSMEQLKVSDPSAYEAVRGRGIQAIDAHRTAITAGLRVRNIAVSYDSAANSLTFDKERFSERFPEAGESLDRALATFYGGDFTAAMRDKGAKFKENAATNLDASNADIVFSGALSELEDVDALARIDAITALDGYKARLSPIEQTGDKGITQASTSRDKGQRGSVKDSSLVSLIDKTEGGGDYNTLFSFANRAGGDFAGVNVSEMTIGDLMAFSNGEYGAWSREKLGYKATPMGRYQIVGTTLAQTAKEMGISDNVVFTPEVQDAMFHHLVVKSLKGKTTPEAKRAALRGTWEGFHSASDQELDAAIAEFEGTPVPSYTELQGKTAVGNAMVRPQLRPEAAQSSGEVFASVRPRARPEEGATVDQPATREATPSEATRSPETAANVERVWAKLSDQTKGMLVRLFGNEEGARDAISKGEILEEDII